MTTARRKATGFWCCADLRQQDPSRRPPAGFAAARPFPPGIPWICRAATLFAFLGLACGDGTDGARNPTPAQVEAWAPAGVVSADTLAHGSMLLYRLDPDDGSPRRYLYRRNHTFPVAAADALERDGLRPFGPPGSSGRVLVHFDSHSDMHPARTCAEADSLIAGSRRALEDYLLTLSVSSFVLSLLRYGMVDEVWWVQPEIASYSGPMESYAFDLRDQDEWINVALRPGAAPAPRESLGVRQHQGRPVPRVTDLITAIGVSPLDWDDGPFRLHALSLRQLEEWIAKGAFAGKVVLVDLDLDFFGTAGPLRGYGYLDLPDAGQTAVGLLGGTVPVFWLPPEELTRSAAEVHRVMTRLDPAVVAISESPDHSHRGTLPALESVFWNRRVEDDTLEVRINTAAGAASLDSDCEAFLDGGEQGRLRLEVRGLARLPRASQVSVYWSGPGTSDRLVHRWTTKTANPIERYEIVIPQVPVERRAHGWSIAIRDVTTGGLLYATSFAILRGLDDLEETLRAADVPWPPEEVATMAPSRIIQAGRRAGLSTETIHRILLSDPATAEWQCNNLRRFRAGAGTVRPFADHSQ